MELPFGVLHFRDSLRQQIRDLLERRILFDEPAVHPREQPFNLIAQPRLGQGEHGAVLAQLVRRHLLAIALNVERGRDDLALLLGQGAHLTSATATAATAAAHPTVRGGTPC